MADVLGTASNVLTLSSSVSKTKDWSLRSVDNLSIPRTGLGLRQSVVVQHIAVVSMSDTLTLRQNWVTHYPVLTQTLDLDQSAVGQVQRQVVSQSLVWTQGVNLTRIRGRTLTDDLGLSQAISYFLQTPCVLWPVDSETQHNGVVLTYPHSGPVISQLTLRNPDFADGEIFEFRRINRKTRGLTLDVFRDPMWPISKQLKYSYSALSLDQKNKLLSFLDLTLGVQIGLLDYDSRQWVGIITTPAAAIKEVIRNSFSVVLVFEGDLT